MNLAVALMSPPYTTLTYATPASFPDELWAAGLRVLVPLGASMIRVGMVLATNMPDLPDTVKLRSVLWPLERTPLCSAAWVSMIGELAARQMVSPGQVLSAALPLGLRSIRLKLRRQQEGKRPVLLSVRELVRMEECERNALAGEWLGKSASWLAPGEDTAASECCVLLKDPPWSVRPSAVRQLAVLDHLYEHGTTSRRTLVRMQGQGSAQALDSLVRAGIVAIRTQDEDDDPEHGLSFLSPPDVSFALSEAQHEAFLRCAALLKAGKASTELVHGVTGSGKTVLYLELARACLQQGRSVFLLAPEVALALKLRRDAKAALGDVSLFFFHGYQGAAQKERIFVELARRSEPCVVVGTRSALFLPVCDPGLIVLDEEHDASFKQDEGLTYHAKELAWFRARQSSALLVLGSATPDVKTFHAAKSDQIDMVRLPDRVGGGRLPAIRLVDIRNVDLSESPFAPESLLALRQTVEAGDQAVILLNRRGYAPLMYCLDCGKVVRCPHCDIGLTYHKGRERMLCHYCGYSVPFPSPCPTCRGVHFLPMGQGTEKVEETLLSVLPGGCGVLRLDRDSTRCPGRMEEILEAFALRKAQVLVGTQMLSKGHHFPDVTLALVADGDLGLNMPDYRASERTFQLLVQSAGRAGRGSKAGQVLIQTRDTGHYCWQFVRNADYEGFYEHEIALRRKRRYPPFMRLALVRMSHADTWKEAAAEQARLAAVLRTAGKEAGVVVLGPAPAPLALLRGRRRIQCLLKASDWGAVRKVYAALLNARPHAEMRVSLDMDPVNML